MSVAYAAADVPVVVRVLRTRDSVLHVVDFVNRARFTTDGVLIRIFAEVLGPWNEVARNQFLVRLANLAPMMMPAVRGKLLRCVPAMFRDTFWEHLVWAIDPFGFMTADDHTELLGLVPALPVVGADAPETTSETTSVSSGDAPGATDESSGEGAGSPETKYVSG
jgi:hypothetical protein